jgi:hypothetical protein
LPFFKKKEVARGWGANPGPLDFIYFLIFTTLPLSHSGSLNLKNALKIINRYTLAGFEPGSSISKEDAMTTTATAKNLITIKDISTFFIASKCQYSLCPGGIRIWIVYF